MIRESPKEERERRGVVLAAFLAIAFDTLLLSTYNQNQKDVLHPDDGFLPELDLFASRIPRHQRATLGHLINCAVVVSNQVVDCHLKNCGTIITILTFKRGKTETSHL